jgi:hypothetical protein
MEHLQIAYDLFVIMIAEGAALSIVVFWAVRTGESDFTPSSFYSSQILHALT